MSNSYTITCKKECWGCKHQQLYDENHKFPFHCYRPGQYQNPAIRTEEYCGKVFKEPQKNLKSCKFYN